MSGAGGHIILISTRQVLSDPLVSGSLPTVLRGPIAMIIAKDIDQWNDLDKIVAAHAYSWALCNL